MLIVKNLHYTKVRMLLYWNACIGPYTGSPPILDTVYFTKRTGHLKIRYSRIFSLSEHNKHTKLHSQYRKN